MEIDFVSLADFLEELAERRGEKLQGAATYLARRLRASPSHEWLIDNPSAPYIKPASPEERQRLTRLLRYVAEHGKFERPDTRPPVRAGATMYDRMYRAASPAEISPNPDRFYSIGGFHREEVGRIVGNDAAGVPEKERADDGDESIDKGDTRKRTRVDLVRPYIEDAFEKLRLQGERITPSKVHDHLLPLIGQPGTPFLEHKPDGILCERKDEARFVLTFKKIEDRLRTWEKSQQK